ncbi:MAG: hypothetical protein AB8G18_01140 [Gammaproteobacteria bacterium]
MSNDQSKSPITNPVQNPQFYRRKARALLRAMRSTQPEQASQAIQRFLQLRSFAGKTALELAEPKRIRLKHALAVIAEESGYVSWSALVASCNEKGQITTSLEAMYSPAMAAMMNRWFSDYSEAVVSLESMGGYLLPYGKQFFVTERGGIEVIGLDPEDSDWPKIGFNWLQPRDYSAWLRLWKKRRTLMAANGQDSS